MGTDPTTEEKIKNAARRMFLRKGFAATKTRDIAEEAGLNLALLNYYFRSKEKLFHDIMKESLAGFFENIQRVFVDTGTTLEEKFSLLAHSYIDHITKQPDTPMFILSELRARPDEFVKEVSGGIKLLDSSIFHQLVEEIGMKRVQEINPLHIMMNLMSMIVFPFVGRPMLEKMGEVDDELFNTLMQERKEMIPRWVMQMIK